MLISHPSSTLYQLQLRHLGVFGKEARSFLKELGQHLNVSSGDPLAHQYLVQHISVALQRRNVAAVLGCAALRDEG